MIRSKTHVKTNFCLHIQVLLTIRMGLCVLGQNHGKDLLVSFNELFRFRNTRNKDGKICKINTLPYRCSSRPHPILYCFLYNLLFIGYYLPPKWGGYGSFGVLNGISYSLIMKMCINIRQWCTSSSTRMAQVVNELLPRLELK